MATSVAAGGKLSLARDKGIPLPPGWALDATGDPTTDANRATILPAVRRPTRAPGLAMMFETLTSLMVGNPLLGPLSPGAAGAGRHRQNSVVAAVDIGAFTDLAAYRAEVDRLIDGCELCRASRGVASEVMRSRRAGGSHDRGAPSARASRCSAGTIDEPPQRRRSIPRSAAAEASDA